MHTQKKGIAEDPRWAGSGGLIILAQRAAIRQKLCGGRHSHSIVLGGFDEMSYTTRFTPRTSLVIREETRARKSCGRRAQSAVIPSVDVTARSTTVFS